VPTVSLHVHERIDPRTIIEAVRRLTDPGPQLIATPKTIAFRTGKPIPFHTSDS